MSMTSGQLVFRNLTYYWRTNAAVVMGVAAAVAVLAGALLVGDSVRGSLRDLVLRRIGSTDLAVLSSGFFREQLAEDLRTYRLLSDDLGVLTDFTGTFDGICPMVILPGFISVQAGSGSAGQVLVYGVDDRFWRFHSITAVNGPEGRDALLSPALAVELGAEAGATLLVRVQRPSSVPLESLHGRKEDLGRTIRATVRAVLEHNAMGEFSLQTQQGEVRAVFLPLPLLQQELEVEGRANTLLVSSKPGIETATAAALERMIQAEVELPDFGMNLQILKGRNLIVLEADGGLLDEAKARAVLATARQLELRAQPVFTYLANTLGSGGREIPYSLVTAIDLPALADQPAPASAAGPFPIFLSDWAARDLRVAEGATVTMEYYVWEDPGQLVSRTAEFHVAGVVPLSTGDRDLAPVYPGISDSPSLADWDSPFPIDLRRIRSSDEEYWKIHRTTPKAYVPFAVGRELWQSRYGSMSSVRLMPPPGKRLHAIFGLDPTRQLETLLPGFIARLLGRRLSLMDIGLAVREVRAESLDASQGATDFGAYFVYFSFFLVVSALLLAALFFRLSVEQRAREVGLLRAVGFKTAAVRGIFLREGLWLSMTGAAAGVLGGIGYAYLMMAALRTWWVGAVGTTALTLHFSPLSIAAGAVGGMAAAMACIGLTLRHLAAVSERRLLAGQIDAEPPASSRPRGGGWTLVAGLALAVLGAGLILSAALGFLDRAGAFFLAGMALLASCLLLFVSRFRRPEGSALSGRGWRPMARLGWRNAAYRPARSVTAMAMIASATFILMAVDSFRREEAAVASDRSSGAGGYSLMVESLLPIIYDPDSSQGRAALGVAGFDAVSIEPFRLRPGDDASCLNLYAPKSPRIIAPRDGFLEQGRFSFRSSLASTDTERANPWLLLHRNAGEGVVPVIADANSMTYVLHRALGEDILLTLGGRQVRLRLMAALQDSIFQGELVMSQENFVMLFPEREGFQSFLVETPPEQQAEVAAAMEKALTDSGADVRSTAQRLAEFHRVENTYLSTFQMLGGLGLLLGTFGLGAVLLRNVMERRQELALLRALGYRQTYFFAMVIAENGIILLGGLLTGMVCALLVIAPAVLEHGGRLPAGALFLLLGSVLVAGLVTSLAATVAALRSSLLSALRSE